MNSKFISTAGFFSRMNNKGVALMQVVIESVIVIALVAAIIPVTAGYAASGRREDVRLRIAAANVSALETVRQAYRDAGSLDAIIDYSVTNGDYVTQITSLESVAYGGSVLYRVAVDTRHNGVTNRGTELVTYVSAR